MCTSAPFRADGKPNGVQMIQTAMKGSKLRRRNHRGKHLAESGAGVGWDAFRADWHCPRHLTLRFALVLMHGLLL
jgi:hypothetical protein